MIAGSSGFDALLGGGREVTGGEYARLEAHGFYWTASETDASSAWFYNFGKGGVSLNRHREDQKERAWGAQCIRNQG